MSSGDASSTVIRRARAADLPALGRLGALLVRAHHEFDPERFIAATSETPQGYAWFLGTQLERPEAVLLVADRAGEIVGYAYGSLEGRDYMALRGPAGVLHDIVVDPDRRGNGVGRRLLEEMITELERLGAPRVVLSTAARNEGAQRLFARAGFRPTMVEMTREAGG
jgi:ribosomal protein S18 acetylase RimI-like enzyme